MCWVYLRTAKLGSDPEGSGFKKVKLLTRLPSDVARFVGWHHPKL